MSKRTSIAKALTEKLKSINGTSPYTTDLADAVFPKLVFWDECQNFPAVFVIPGSESREYLPSDFTWGFLALSLKLYCKGDNSQDQLETLLEDVEKCIDRNRVLVYDQAKGWETTEILITSITTDEGLLAPYAVGEITLQVRYQVM